MPPIDSVTQVEPRHEGCLVVTGSHGGASVVPYARAVRAWVYVFNDAGVGKDDAGIAALELLQADGIAAANVIGRPFTARGIDFLTGAVTDMTAEPATDEETTQTVKVMGGEDWELWIRRLRQEGALAQGALTIALSYIGPELTRAIYRDGTIGRAKADLEATARRIDALLEDSDGRALISVNKALVTRASAVIPGVPLYIALLYRVMKDKGLHESCIQQIDRLHRDYLFSRHPLTPDAEGRIRLDDREMRPDVQREVSRLWGQISTENVGELSDIAGFREEYLRYHGFGVPGIDYTADVPT